MAPVTIPGSEMSQEDRILAQLERSLRLMEDDYARCLAAGTRTGEAVGCSYRISCPNSLPCYLISRLSSPFDLCRKFHLAVKQTEPGILARMGRMTAMQMKEVFRKGMRLLVSVLMMYW